MRQIYFVFGNIWLLTALALMVGKKVERGNPTMYSFFRISGWHYPSTYALFTLICLGLGVLFFHKSVINSTSNSE